MNRSIEDAVRFVGRAGEYDRAGNRSMRDWCLCQAEKRYRAGGWDAAADLVGRYIRTPLGTTIPATA